MTIYHFIFTAAAFFSIYIQTKTYALKTSVDLAQGSDPDLERTYTGYLRVRRWLSPVIAALAAVLVGIGAFLYQGTSLFIGALLFGVWVFAALGDIFIEGSYSITNEKMKGTYYIIGMLLFIVFTFGLGVGLIVNSVVTGGASLLWVLAAAVVSVLFGITAYRTMAVTAETLVIMLVYTGAVTTLLCGGLLSAVTGSAHLGYIGIAYFFSDWCVGLRDFGKNPPRLLKENILIVILILYYTIMLTSIDLVF